MIQNDRITTKFGAGKIKVHKSRIQIHSDVIITAVVEEPF
jgi:hypothetical protein